MHSKYMIEAPPGMVHVANDGEALTEQDAIKNYYEFYRGHIPVEDFVILNNPHLKGNWAICVPVKWKALCDRAHAQLEAQIEMFKQILEGRN